ncbi:MAG TPA: nuclear transport factor 2 family protein [Rhizomicrobium sp.]|nr:nuclear transport factor 2 family protein [Rhizomicrobium sp.]
MTPTICRVTGGIAVLVLLSGSVCAASVSGRNAIDAAIKARVRDIVTGINTQNADLATSHDAPNIITMETNQANTTGVAADASGFKQAFASDPTWRVSLVEEAVDVGGAGDMAVYRSVYNQDGTQSNVPVTQKVNFVSGWSRRADGAWTMNWYVVSEIEKPHKK